MTVGADPFELGGRKENGARPVALGQGHAEAGAAGAAAVALVDPERVADEEHEDVGGEEPEGVVEVFAHAVLGKEVVDGENKREVKGAEEG